MRILDILYVNILLMSLYFSLSKTFNAGLLFIIE